MAHMRNTQGRVEYGEKNAFHAQETAGIHQCALAHHVVLGICRICGWSCKL